MSPDHSTEAEGAGRTPAPVHSAGVLRDVRRWARDLVVAVLIAVIIVVFFYQPVKVEGTSMLPELVDQERIFVNKFVYRIDEIERGDIVVFRYPLDPERSYIKRVIGLPGEVIEIRGGSVYVSGVLLNEEYLAPEYFDGRSFPAIVVEPDSYFVMGDHRNESNDSRMWGLVPVDNIDGKAVFRYWPVGRMGSLQ